MPGQEPIQFTATCAFGNQPAKVTVSVSGHGEIRLGLQPWVSAVRFTPEQFDAMVAGLAALRAEA